jgi:hypothetical protein
LTNNILTDYLVFNDIAVAILEEESRHKNKKDRINNSHQAAPDEVKGKEVPNQEVKRL